MCYKSVRSHTLHPLISFWLLPQYVSDEWDFFALEWTWGLGDKVTWVKNEVYKDDRLFPLSPQPPCSPCPNFTGKSLIRTVLAAALPTTPPAYLQKSALPYSRILHFFPAVRKRHISSSRLVLANHLVKKAQLVCKSSLALDY